MKRVLFVGQEPETVDFSDPRSSPLAKSRVDDVGAGLGAAAIAEKWMTGRAAMLADTDQGGPRQNTRRGTQIDAKI
jgi:hypothetical protein